MPCQIDRVSKAATGSGRVGIFKGHNEIDSIKSTMNTHFHRPGRTIETQDLPATVIKRLSFVGGTTTQGSLGPTCLH